MNGYAIVAGLAALYAGITALLSLRVRRITGEGFLKGSSNYGTLFHTIITMGSLAWLFQTSWYLFIICFAIIIWSLGEVGQMIMGENGLKVSFQFFSRERILGYQMVGDRVNELDLIISGNDRPVRVTVNSKLRNKGLEELLDEYLKR